jgi:hypothetical protein
MLEDEFDFAGQNPARHLPLDRKAIPFDYESRLQQQGYTKESPPDIGGLFKALASEYVPTRVVHLPPKVVTRIHIRDRFAGLFFSFLFYYLPLVGLLGIAIPYANFSSYEAKVHLQPGATCTVTSMHVESLEDSDNNVYYSPVVKFTLRTPDGKSYQAYEYWPGSYNQQADAQQYISRFQINQSYPCWYDSMNPTEASFFKVDVDFWDHFWLLVSAVLFLACGVLPNMLIVCVMGLFLIDLVHRRIELAW